MSDLPPRTALLRACRERDRSCDGLFFQAVTTTGIFCRPSCPARPARAEHLQFYPTAAAALQAGFRPCLRCRPLEPAAPPPEWAAALLARVDADPTRRITDADLRQAGLVPATVRRWFQATYGLTFQAYVRARRLGAAFTALQQGQSLDATIGEHDWESHAAFRSAFTQAVGRPPGTARHGEVMRLGWIESPLGLLAAGVTDAAVWLLEFADRRLLPAQVATLRQRSGLPLLPGEHPLLEALREQLADWFAGTRRDFDLPLAAPGSPFQERVWAALRQIPYGQTRTYAELAAALGKPGAARAVGRANGLNRLAILIPCHRVVAADGGLGGYGGGLWRKLRLLETEGARPLEHGHTSAAEPCRPCLR
ncbi:MAG: methylated-DNA--[protein]-cysteine S-methyltransferase [Fimbriimonadaceae bacterium]|nr:methylated-DNA--[protein]-cysteine S-methyltransferase [Fimbriimonadaceae bacterium]